jgi:predicted enzyme related to lactoylglutathione lyase
VKKEMPKVIHFEISAQDTQRAVKFYKDSFGWEINKYGPMDYWLVKAGDDKEIGINGAINGEGNFKGTINTISVRSYEDAVKKIVKAGGKVLSPKNAVPRIGYMSYCQDTEGNVFGIMQTDPSAK